MYLKRLYIQYQTSLCLGFGSGAHFLCHCPLFLLEGGKNKWWLKALKYLCGTESSQEDHNDLSTKPRRYQDGLFVRQAPLTWSAVIGGGIEVTSVLPLLWQDLLVSSSGAHSVAWETETRQKKKKSQGMSKRPKKAVRWVLQMLHNSYAMAGSVQSQNDARKKTRKETRP